MNLLSEQPTASDPADDSGELRATGAAPPRLPPEIIDAVIDNIDNHTDLLSMACSCRLYNEYALKVYYQRHFESHGLPWISRLLWPGTHYDDPLKDKPTPEDSARALRMLRRGTPFCDPNEIWYHQPPGTPDISYLYFRRKKGGIGTGYCFGRYPMLHFAAYSGLDDIVEHLIESGANVNATPTQHTSDEDVVLSHLTPLFMAAYGSSVTSARILLEHGASIEMSWVAALQSGNPEMVQLMIDSKPDLVHEPIYIYNKTMNSFSAALDFSEDDPVPVIATLVANGADTAYANAYNQNVHQSFGFAQGLVEVAQRLGREEPEEG